MADVHHHHRSGGVGIAGLLLVLFVALKLTGNIAWHWAWVVSPAWLPLAVVVGVGLVFAVGALLIAAGVAAAEAIHKWWSR